MIYNLLRAKKMVIPIIEPELTNSWSVADISGVPYKFTLNSSGYYESNNKGISSSAAMCRVNLHIENACNVMFKCINSGESNFDFGLLSKLDSVLDIGDSDTSTNVEKSFKGLSSADVQTYTYSNVAIGDHFIDVKYRKDSSSNEGNDSLQFTVEFV